MPVTMSLEYAAAIYHFRIQRHRRESTMAIQENADCLQMGSRKSVAFKLHDFKKSHERTKQLFDKH